MRSTSRSAAIVALILATALAPTACTKKNETSSPSGGTAASGQSSAPSAGGATYKVAFGPKLQGIPYFEAMNAGGKQAASELGNVDWLYQGSTSADAAAQADIVSSYIQQKVDALFIAPNDPDSMAPLIKQAADAGIKIDTSDTDAPNSVRNSVSIRSMKTSWEASIRIPVSTRLDRQGDAGSSANSRRLK